MESAKYYAVSSGLSAVTFSSLYDSGGNFIAQGDRVIEAQRLVSAGPVCRVTSGGVKNLYFSTVNSTDETKVVSRMYKANRMYSVTGGAAPPDYFPPGTSGFMVPESHFNQGTAINGIWYFLGQNVTVNNEVPICADTGSPAQCSVVTQDQLRAPIAYTRAVVVRLTKMASALAKKGVWKASNGAFAMPFWGRGASAIAAMQKALEGTTRGTAYVCDSQPAPSCTLTSLTGFKRIAQSKFGGLFRTPIPKGLSSIAKLGPQEGRRFKASTLDKLPNAVWICPPGVTPSSN
jgi:hypothetical protein